MALIEKSLVEQMPLKSSESKSQIKENQVIVGSAKPFMRYVRSAEILLRNKNLKSISVRARGAANIGKAVDLIEAVKNRFCEDLGLKSSVITSTEKFTTKENKEVFVSVIEIFLDRK
jgi:DNA-binding protein Alba